MVEKPKRKNDQSSWLQLLLPLGTLIIIGAIAAFFFLRGEDDASSDAVPSSLDSQTTQNEDAVAITDEEAAVTLDNEIADLGVTPDGLCEEALPAENPDSRQYEQADDVLEDGIDYRAVFCTTAGNIYIDLFEDQTPITVNNLVFLANEGYYNNTIFHRVLEDFMAQGGDPTGTGRGGPGYQFEDEFVPELQFDRPYLLAMANAGPGTNGSQFFITFAETPWLNNAHTIYGEVIAGQENVDNIMLRDPSVPSSPSTKLETVVVVEVPEE